MKFYEGEGSLPETTPTIVFVGLVTVLAGAFIYKLAGVFLSLATALPQ